MYKDGFGDFFFYRRPSFVRMKVPTETLVGLLDFKRRCGSSQLENAVQIDTRECRIIHYSFGVAAVIAVAAGVPTADVVVVVPGYRLNCDY